MPVSVRALALAASILLAAEAAVASGGIFLPPAPQGSGGEDSIETGSGTRCRQSINSNGAYLDLGAVGSAASEIPEQQRQFFGATTPEREAMAYARVTVPLGRRPKRIDCSSVYELELAKLRQELELLRMGGE